MFLNTFDNSQIEVYDSQALSNKLGSLYKKPFDETIDTESNQVRRNQTRNELLYIFRFFIGETVIPESNVDDCSFDEIFNFLKLCEIHDVLLDSSIQTEKAIGDKSGSFYCFVVMTMPKIQLLIDLAKQSGYELISEALIKKYGWLIQEAREKRQKIIKTNKIAQTIEIFKKLLLLEKIKPLSHNYEMWKKVIMQKILYYMNFSIAKTDSNFVKLQTTFSSLEEAKKFFDELEEKEMVRRYANKILSGAVSFKSNAIDYCKMISFLFEHNKNIRSTLSTIAVSLRDMLEILTKQDESLITDFIKALKKGQEFNIEEFNQLGMITMSHGNVEDKEFIVEYVIESIRKGSDRAISNFLLLDISCDSNREVSRKLNEF